MSNIKETDIELFATYFDEAESVLLGSGAGLTAAAGPLFNFSDTESFAKNYPGLLQYGFKQKMELMGFGIFKLELQWGYYSQNVQEVRYTKPDFPIYDQLLDIMATKENYFVITTNVDALFERSGFPKERIYTPQGDYARMQCLIPCTNETWDSRPFLDKMLSKTDPKTQMIIDTEAIPKCPNCGTTKFFMNVRGSDAFIHEPYENQAIRYKKWIDKNKSKKLLVIDIGSGFNTPVWVRWPAERLVKNNSKAHLVRINLFQPEVPDEIISRSIQFKASAGEVIEALWSHLKLGKKK